MNKRIKKRVSWMLSVSLVLVLMLSACQSPAAGVLPVLGSSYSPQADASQSSENKRFLEFIDQVFYDEITSETIGLHYTLAYPENFSISDYPITFGNIGEKYWAEDMRTMQSYKDTMLSFNYDELDEENQVTYDIFMWSIETDLSSADFEYYSEFLNPTTGLQAQMPVLLAEYTFRTERDVTDYLELIASLDEYYSEIVLYQQEKSAAGLFMADFTLDSILEQCSDVISDTENHYLIDTFDSRVDALDFLTEEQKAGYKADNIEALNAHVFPAYQLLIDGLDDLRGTGTNELGLCYYPKGKEYYEYLVKASTGSDRSVEELIMLTQEQMGSYIEEIRAIASKSRSVFDRYEAASDSLEKIEPMALLEQLQIDILEHYPAPPDVNYEVKQVDPALAEHLSPGFYLTPPIDVITENTIYVNPASSGYDDPSTFFSLMAHEGYPGHLYQNVYTASQELDKLRYLLYFPGYSEGYATYAESYAYHYMGLDSDIAELYRLDSLYTLGLYATVDFGIHYKGWSIEDVGRYLYIEFGIDDESVAVDIFQYIVADPANYLKYYIGCVEIMELREKATTSGLYINNRLVWNILHYFAPVVTLIIPERAWFSPIEFHDRLLSIGSAPFSVLEKHMLN